MKAIKLFMLLAVVGLVLNSCKKEVDTEKPTVDMSSADAFPKSCDTIYFDEPFTIKALLSDNVELGSYNIDFHHNFDQHTHSTEIESCTYDPVKTPLNPYLFIEDYSIPEASSQHEVALQMTIPSTDGTNQYDEGDYHFHLSITDKEGWSSQIGLNVKILHR